MNDATALYDRFIAWRNHARLPMHLHKPSDMIAGFLNTVAEGGTPNREITRLTATAAAEIEAWKYTKD